MSKQTKDSLKRWHTQNDIEETLIKRHAGLDSASKSSIARIAGKTRNDANGVNQSFLDTEGGIDCDPIYDEARDFVLTSQSASVSKLQQHLKIGYMRAERLLEEMERNGVITKVNERGQRMLSDSSVAHLSNITPSVTSRTRVYHFVALAVSLILVAALWYADYGDFGKVTEFLFAMPVTSEQKSQLFGLLFLGLIVFVFVLVAIGKVIFYYDTTDAVWSILVFVFPVVGWVISKLLTPEQPSDSDLVIPDLVFKLGLTGAIFASLKSIYNAIVFNKSLAIGFIVGIFKIAMGGVMSLTILGMLEALTNDRKDRSVRQRVAIFAMFVVLFGLIWKFLVNGHRVRGARN